ncbi:MAG: hypothetical protein R3A45_11855 [Bdellovibrionota bacterium]
MMIVTFPLFSFAEQEQTVGSDTQTFENEINQKIEVLAEEVSNIKSGFELFPKVGEGKYGLAPAASKIYQVDKGVSIGGYGEMLYENFAKKISLMLLRAQLIRSIFYVILFT